MNHQLTPKTNLFVKRERGRRLQPDYKFPSVSIFIPFNPKMEPKDRLLFSLSEIVKKVTRELKMKYPGEMASLTIQKLVAIIDGLNFNTFTRSLALFVSPVFEKVYYFNIELEKAYSVRDHFQLRDVLNYKKESRRYYLVALDEKESRIYISNTDSSVIIASERQEYEKRFRAVSINPAIKFPGISMSKETNILDFLGRVDRSLGILLKTTVLPVFVTGKKELVDEFKDISENKPFIMDDTYHHFRRYSPGNFQQHIQEALPDWQMIRERMFLYQLEHASDMKVLSTGWKDVLKEIYKTRGGALFIERMFPVDAHEEIEPGPHAQKTASYSKYSCVKTPLDEMIEEVLLNNGTVEMVNNGFLKNYGRISYIPGAS